MAKTFGATDTVNAADGDPVAQIMEMTGGGVHYSFEAIGLKATAEQAFGMLRAGGTATVIGMIPVGVKIELMGAAFCRKSEFKGLLWARIDLEWICLGSWTFIYRVNYT
jgi:S-(hydroxymethyl)glutathione dehydrogenase/alcohol dehydrogenase